MSKKAGHKALDSEAIKRGVRGAFLAWLVPGAGHFALGARRRAVVFFAVIVFTIGIGLACDGNLAVVDAQRAPVLSGLQLVGNVALGPVEPLIRYALYGRLVYQHPGEGSPVPSAKKRAIDVRTQRSFRAFSIYGTAYLMAAGLMNMLLIMDAWDIGIGRRR